MKAKLRDMDYKAHIEQTGKNSFTVYQVKEHDTGGAAGNEPTQVTVTNPQAAQLLQFDLSFNDAADGAVITLPDRTKVECNQKIAQHQRIECKGDRMYLADGNYKEITALTLAHPAQLPAGESKIGVQFKVDGNKKVRFGLKTWVFDKGEKIGK